MDNKKLSLEKILDLEIFSDI